MGVGSDVMKALRGRSGFDHLIDGLHGDDAQDIEDQIDDIAGAVVPDWIKCVASTEPNKSMCGAQIMGGFVTVDHALKTVQNGGRLVPCGACMVAAWGNSG